MNIISTDKGTYDLSTNEGRYKYIAEFMVSKGASGDLLSCLEKLFTQAEKSEDLKELHRMQLVACSTAALANTDKSKEFRIGKENDYWTPAYQDVCDAVDREIRYREALEFTISAAEYLYKTESPVPRGLSPEFYHSLSYEGDVELIAKTKKARAALEGKE